MDRAVNKGLEIMKTAKSYNNWLFLQTKPYLKEEVLEIGAGIGNFTKKLSQRAHVTAIDIDTNYQQILKKLANNKITTGYGDIEKGKYFFKNKKFGSIVCFNVLEHIKSDQKAFVNINSLLKKNGTAIIIVPAFSWAYTQMDKGIGHFRRYTKEEVAKKLTKANFTVVHIRYLNVLGLFGWYINGKILKKKIVPKNQLAIFDKVAIPILYFEKYLKLPLGLSVFAVAQKK